MQVVELLVDLIGIEPMTSSMPWKRAPSCATGPLSGRTHSILEEPAAFVNVFGNLSAIYRCLKIIGASERSSAAGAVFTRFRYLPVVSQTS